MLLIPPINMIVFISLSVALYRSGVVLAATALACGLFSFACLIICRPLAELLYLSGRYAVAAGVTERAALTSAAEGLLSYFKGTAWMIQTALYPVAGLIYAFLMRKSKVFSKADSVVGIIVSASAFGFVLPKLGLLFLFANTIGTIPWYIMIARRLFSLARLSRA
jgi:hypothetical protein